MDGGYTGFEALVALWRIQEPYLITRSTCHRRFALRKARGLMKELQLQIRSFAQESVTFGKAMGCHGAAILGSDALKKLFGEFCSAVLFITTGIAPHSLATICSLEQVAAQKGSKIQL